MRLVVCAACVLTLGCGRVGFDLVAGDDTGGDDGGPGDDGSTGDGAGDDAGEDAAACVTGPMHDEDGDGIRDSCDVCPHIPDQGQADMDADRVGDACDPEPANSRQSIVLFDPFVTIDASWTNMGATQGTDEIVMDARGNNSRRVIRTITPTHDLFMIGAATSNGDAGTHHISLVTFPAVGNSDAYCEMIDSGSSTDTQFTWTFDNVMYMHGTAAAWGATRLANGSGVFSYDLGPTQSTCSSTWQSNQRIGIGPRPAIAPERFMIYAENILINVRYIIIIRTGP